LHSEKLEQAIDIFYELRALACIVKIAQNTVLVKAHLIHKRTTLSVYILDDEFNIDNFFRFLGGFIIVNI